MSGFQRTTEWRREPTDHGFIRRSGRSLISRVIPAGLAALIFGLVCGGTARANHGLFAD
jgi:hypothetical protein